MKRKLVGTLLIIGLISTLYAHAKQVCHWGRNGCYTYIEQDESGWKMIIGCKDGVGGVWTGRGEWGGVCRTGWKEVQPNHF